MASHTLVSIRILDVNDNPPELATPYEASICEDAKPGQVCFYVIELFGFVLFSPAFPLRGVFAALQHDCISSSMKETYLATCLKYES